MSPALRGVAAATRTAVRTGTGRTGTAAPVLALSLLLCATTLLSVPDRVMAATDEPSAVDFFDWPFSTDDTAGSVIAPPPSEPPEAEAEVRTIELKPRPKRGPFSMNLYSRGDFVSQQTAYWCIAASVQTMINIIEDDEPDRSRAYQRRLHFQARALDDRHDWFWQQVAGRERWEDGLHGLGIRDWAELLNAEGFGPFELDRARTRKQAIRMAARAIRLTGRPAGLVVWRGAHAWVMSGFTATADPAWSDDFKVTSVFIQDPWYPAVSSIWGASRPPNSAVPVRALDQDYLRYDRPGRKHPKRDGKYMLVLPTLPPGTEVATRSQAGASGRLTATDGS